MMAARKQKSPPAPVAVVETVHEQPQIRYLADPVTTAYKTPKTREEIALRDAVRSRLAVVETAVMAFVDEKLQEGFTSAEIDALYAVELPVLFGYHFEGGRIRAQYDAQIVERQA